MALQMEAESLDQATAEFLTFRLGDEEYGIDILKVQEIRGCDRVTAIANMPEFIRGVIDLRGIIVPIIDLRKTFGLPSAEYNQFTVVIILNVASRVVGVVVDGVSDVIMLPREQIKPAPEFSSALDTEYILGLGKLDERMIIFVDIDRLMTSERMGLIESAATSSTSAA